MCNCVQLVFLLICLLWLSFFACLQGLRLTVVQMVGLRPCAPVCGLLLLSVVLRIFAPLLMLFADCVLCDSCGFMGQILSVQLASALCPLGSRNLRYFSRLRAGGVLVSVQKNTPCGVLPESIARFLLWTLSHACRCRSGQSPGAG